LNRGNHWHVDTHISRSQPAEFASFAEFAGFSSSCNS
jgi:hypothetical protein